MARVCWKNYFIDNSILKKLMKKKVTTDIENEEKTVYYSNIFSRASTIYPMHVGQSFQVYNGKRFYKLLIVDEMIGSKFGEFSNTTNFSRMHFVAKMKAKVMKNKKKIKKK